MNEKLPRWSDCELAAQGAERNYMETRSDVTNKEDQSESDFPSAVPVDEGDENE